MFNAGFGILKSDSPLSVPGCQFFNISLESNTMTFNGGDISEWRDKSKNQYHLVQGTGANQATYLTNAINGLPVIEYDVDDVMDTAVSIPGANLVDSSNWKNQTIYLVYTQPISTANRTPFFWINGAVYTVAIIYHGTDILYRMSSAAGVISGSPSDRNGGYYIIELRRVNDSGTVNYYRDGLVMTDTDAMNSASLSGVSATLEQTPYGNVGAMIIFNWSTDAPSHATILRYLANNFGL